MMLKVLTPPAFLPVSLAEAQAWCRVIPANATTEENAVLTLLLGAMTDYAENLTGRAFARRTLRLSLSGWPWLETRGYYGHGIALPQAPLLELSSVQYRDLDGELQTLGTELYAVYEDAEPALIVPAWQEVWPAVRPVLDGVQVTYVAGYAALGSPEDTAAYQAGQPAALKTWIQARVATLFESREQLVAGNMVEIPRAFADGLLDSLVLGERIA